MEQKLGEGDGGESQGPVQYTEKTPSAAMKSKYLRLLSTLLHRGDFGYQPISIQLPAKIIERMRQQSKSAFVKI